jgi:hypothetical protein
MEIHITEDNAFNETTTNSDIELTRVCELFGLILFFICLGNNFCINIYDTMHQRCRDKKKNKLLNDSINNIDDIESIVGDCSVCLDSLHNSKELIQLVCGHIYHKECVYEWISRKNTCPNCRKSILSTEN